MDSMPDRPSKKRTAIRVPYDKDLQLRLANGLTLSGRATNISASGFFLHTADPGRQQALGMKCALILDLQAEMLELPCQVVRVNDNGLGVHFVNDSES